MSLGAEKTINHCLHTLGIGRLEKVVVITCYVGLEDKLSALTRGLHVKWNTVMASMIHQLGFTFSLVCFVKVLGTFFENQGGLWLAVLPSGSSL